MLGLFSLSSNLCLTSDEVTVSQYFAFVRVEHSFTGIGDFKARHEPHEGYLATMNYLKLEFDSTEDRKQATNECYSYLRSTESPTSLLTLKAVGVDGTLEIPLRCILQQLQDKWTISIHLNIYYHHDATNPCLLCSHRFGLGLRSSEPDR